MIQLNTTSQLSHDRLHESIANLASQRSGDSFESALSSARAATPEQFGTGTNPVAAPIVSAATTAAATSTSTPAAVSEAGNPMVEIVASETAASASTSSPASSAITSPVTPATSSASSTDPTQSFDDAYWASQPPAVQALRGMTDEDQRAQVATELQQEGYTIDVPIMVWGWDPSITTSMRQSYGYTWVPAMGQTPLQMAPDLTGPWQAYNPNDPPPGSIIVPPAAS
jgi:hypothetical protein